MYNQDDKFTFKTRFQDTYFINKTLITHSRRLSRRKYINKNTYVIIKTYCQHILSRHTLKMYYQDDKFTFKTRFQDTYFSNKTLITHSRRIFKMGLKTYIGVSWKGVLKGCPEFFSYVLRSFKTFWHPVRTPFSRRLTVLSGHLLRNPLQDTLSGMPIRILFFEFSGRLRNFQDAYQDAFLVFQDSISVSWKKSSTSWKHKKCRGGV